eukprot:gene2982-3438_t
MVLFSFMLLSTTAIAIQALTSNTGHTSSASNDDGYTSSTINEGYPFLTGNNRHASSNGNGGYTPLSSLRKSHFSIDSSNQLTTNQNRQPYPFSISQQQSTKPHTKHAPTAPSIPQYMVDLYETLVKNRRSLPFGAEFARSFTSTGVKSMGEMLVFTYKMKVPAKEQIRYTILQVCLSKDKRNNKPRPSIACIYDVTSKRLVTKIKFNANRCVEVPLGKTVKRVMERPERGKELVLGIKIFNYNRRMIKPEMLKITSTSQYPVLIVFTRNRNSHKLDDKMQSFSSSTNYMGSLVDSLNKKRSSANGGCKTGSLYVNFAGLGYRNILAPTIFDAKQCIGVCRYPLGKMSNPTQHSMIQQLLFSLYGEKVAKSTCCAPRKFAPLTIMLNDTYSKGIVIRSLDDMVVAECGCI